MNRNEGIDTFGALSDRYGVALETEGWDSKKLFGGIAISDVLVNALYEIEHRYGDNPVIVYEMETVQKEFEPLAISLTEDGFKLLRRNLMSHFALLMVPHSRRWAMATTPDMEAIVYGPKEIIDLLPNEDAI
jgi:hypothetical protein